MRRGLSIALISSVLFAAFDATGVQDQGHASYPPVRASLEREIAEGSVTFERLVALQDQILTTPRARGGPGLIARPTFRANSEKTAEGENVQPFAAVDLDGDAIDEVLVFHSPQAYPCICTQFLTAERVPGRLSARESDGRERWGVDADHLAYILPVDLTGDAHPEIVTVERWISEVRAPTPSLSVRVGTRLSALAPSDGSTLWTRTLRSVDYFGQVPFADLFPTGGTGLLVNLQPIPDADGDGKGDLFLETLDYSHAWVPANANAQLTIARGFTLDGSDGRILARVRAHGLGGACCGVGTSVVAQGSADVAPIGDVNDDGFLDVATLDVTPIATSIAARTVDGSSTHWTRMFPEPVAMRVLELDGTPGSELIVLVASGAAEAIDGTSGATIYGHSDGSALFSALEIGDADGDGAVDLAPDLFELDEDPADTYELALISGANGTHIWRHSFEYELPPPERSWLVELGPYGVDVTGDGVGDFFAKYGVGPVDEGDGGWFRQITLDGVDGDPVWELVLPGYYKDMVAAMGDLDGDSASDLILWAEEDSVNRSCLHASCTLETYAGATGELLWSVHVGAPTVEDGWMRLRSSLTARRANGSALVLGLYEYDSSGRVGRFRTRAVTSDGEIWAL